MLEMYLTEVEARNIVFIGSSESWICFRYRNEIYALSAKELNEINETEDR